MGRPCHPFDYGAVGGEVFFLVRWSMPVHIQEFGAVEPDALCAVCTRRDDVLGQLDIGQEVDGLTVFGDRWLCAVSAHLTVREKSALRWPRNACQHVRRHNPPARCRFRHPAPAARHACRQLVAPRVPITAGMPRLRASMAVCDMGPPIVGHESGDTLILHQDHIGRGEVLGQDDLALKFLESRFVLLQQDVQDPVDHVVEVVAPRAQVGILHLFEHPDERHRDAAAGPIRR